MEVTLVIWVNEGLTGVPRRSCEPLLARRFAGAALDVVATITAIRPR